VQTRLCAALSFLVAMQGKRKRFEQQARLHAQKAKRNAARTWQPRGKGCRARSLCTAFNSILMFTLRFSRSGA
jgi:hypothetical protein